MLKRNSKIVSVILGVFGMIFLMGCSANKLSERDKFLQEKQRDRDLKRNELLSVAGEYAGVLSSTNGISYPVRLSLQVKDIPEAGSGADSVLVPKLVGSLRLIIGDEQNGESIDCPIRSSEFVKAGNRLSLVIYHSQFNEMVLAATADGKQIDGTWSAASVSTDGQLQVSKASLQ